MKKYARIDNGFVAEFFFTDGDIKTLFNSSLTWVDVTANAPAPQIGWNATQNESVWIFAAQTVSAAQLFAANISAIQSALDSKAQERGYDSIRSACAYVSSAAIGGNDGISKTRDKFRKEANALQEWMSLTWATAYAYQATVTVGTNPMPTVDQTLSMMPTFAWPN